MVRSRSGNLSRICPCGHPPQLVITGNEEDELDSAKFCPGKTLKQNLLRVAKLGKRAVSNPCLSA